MLMAGDIDMGHARALLPLDKALQITTAHEVIARKLNVREAEKLVAKVQGVGRQAPLLRVKSEKSRDVQRLEEQLSDLLTAQVEIRTRRQSARGLQGEVAIQFGSLDELNGLIDKLRGGRGEA
jgi:ParB family chromosome partitioning protein